MIKNSALFGWLKLVKKHNFCAYFAPIKIKYAKNCQIFKIYLNIQKQFVIIMVGNFLTFKNYYYTWKELIK